VSDIPEVGLSIDAGEVATNYHRSGSGRAVVLVHGSGPGVSAWANWRLTMPALAERYDVVAPDMIGFGFTERPAAARYNLAAWLQHLTDFVDALGLDQFSLIGNSFGGGLALSFAGKFPERVDKLVLMGSTGVPFELTEGLDTVWGYQPSPEAMRRLMGYFAFDPDLVTDELSQSRYQASIRPGFQESFESMFPAPRQRWIDALVVDPDAIRALPHRTLVVHGRDDRVIPLANALRLAELIDRSELHVFGRCGHWTQIEYAAEFNQLVGDFLARRSRNGSPGSAVHIMRTKADLDLPP
jgi:2-hydroxymuconate-semialdehyde hydrolase